MAEKKTKTTKKAAPKTETKPPKAPREKKETEPLVVFAIRLTEAERTAFHKAAGPARATKVMRSLVGAFVKGDRAVFESIVDDARQAKQ